MIFYSQAELAAYRGADGSQHCEMTSPPGRLGERRDCYINAMIQWNFTLA